MTFSLSKRRLMWASFLFSFFILLSVFERLAQGNLVGVL